jgi:hypothetical protein
MMDEVQKNSNIKWMTGVWYPAGQDFSLHHNIQTGSGAHPASYPMDTGFIPQG